MKKQNTQNGNALWFILIAIILLGLLTAMMTRSGGSTNDTGDFERSSILANEILGYARSLENAYQALLARGCSENDISFKADNSANYYINPNSPPDNSCHIFEPEGAGIDYWDTRDETNIFDASLSVQRWIFASHGMSHADAGEPNVMDMHVQLANLNDNVCKAINNIVGVTNTGGNVPDGAGQYQGGGSFTGWFGPTYWNRRFNNVAGNEVDNKLTGCVSITYGGVGGDERNTFYHHLNVR